MRWLFHILTRADHEAWAASGEPAYAPASLASEGFVHASYRDAVRESAALYFAATTPLVVLRIDPSLLEVAVAATPRGPMPHVRGPIPRAAIAAVLDVAEVALGPDQLAEADGADRPR
ncbi:MAG: DUF952 domain-containing protein [Myxococcota bacterium]|nr:DUF952 domain-containing protein [Myxococcota bacterium]